MEPDWPVPHQRGPARGWREYRRTGGKLRWAIDREWVKSAGGRWRKRSRHRRDLPPLTDTQYAQWKASRAEEVEGQNSGHNFEN